MPNDVAGNEPFGDDLAHCPEEAAKGTIYALAMEAMKEYIEVYLALAKETHGLEVIEAQHLQTPDRRLVLLAGLNSSLPVEAVTPEQVVNEWQHMRAIPFDVETAITKGVYAQLRARIATMVGELASETKGFLHFESAYIAANPRMLPILQRLANVSSKAELKRRVGSVSDNSISAASAGRLAEILNRVQPGKSMGRAQLLQSVEPTLEGIVRDLVGRVLLESVVARALDDTRVPYKREVEYRSLEGVVYDFRADFVIPDSQKPKAFIEVRKSSSRHASLYAKDKMFSAINWKGRNKDLLAVLVVEGPWTAETLRVMSNVFDYVVPLKAVSQVCVALAAYLRGDASRLKWLIEFSIKPANQ